jgi:hypothetical protein
MDWLTFISKLIGHIAWPVATFAIVLLLREQIKALLAVVSKVKVSSVEVEFDRKLELVKEEALAVLPQLASSADRSTSIIDTQLLKLAEVSPRAAVMDGWRHVEAAALRAAKALLPEGTFTNKTFTFRAIRIIEKSGAIPESIVDLMRSLRSLRNDAAHAADFGLTVSAAIEYLHLAARVISYLEGAVADRGETGADRPGAT